MAACGSLLFAHKVHGEEPAACQQRQSGKANQNCGHPGAVPRLRNGWNFRHQLVVHRHGDGFASQDLHGLVIRQDILFGILTGHLGNGVLAHPEGDVDLTVLIGLELLLIGVAHEVGAGDLEGAAFDLVVIGCLDHLQGAGLCMVEEAHASFGFHPHDGAVFRDGEGIVPLVTLKKFRGFLLMQEVISVLQVLQLIDAALGLSHFTRQLVDVRVELPVVVHIGIHLEDGTGQRILREVGVYLGGFHSTPDDLVFHGDLNGLPIFGDLHREGFLAQHEGFRRCDLTNDPIANGYPVKFKVPDGIALGDHEGGFFCELGFVKAEQANHGAAQFDSILVHLPAGYLAILQRVFDGFSVIDLQLHGGDVLPCVLEHHRVFLIAQQVVLIRTDLLYIQRGPAGEVGFEGAVPVFIDAGGLDEAIGGDGTAIGGDDFLCGEQAEGDVFPFLIHPDGEGLILLQQLFEVDLYLLPLIDEAHFGGGDRHLLTGVGEGNFLRLGIQHHACGRCPFRNLVAAQVQGLRCGSPIAPCGQGSHQFSRLCVNDAIRGDDILQSGDVVNSARLALHLILRLVEATGFCHMAEHLALLVDGDGAFLHRVILGHGDNVLGAIHHKGYRLVIQNITPGTLLFIQLVISKAQGLRQHEGPCGIRHEGVDVHGAGIVDVLHHPFAGIRIADLHGGAGQRDDLAGFGVPLFKADEGGKGGIVQDEIIGFAMLGNEHGEIRDEFLPLGASGLMHHIQAVWE